MRRIASAITLILLIGILTLTSNVKIAKAAYYYNFTITVIPESPTPQNKVNVTVSLETACINYVVNFSTRSQSGNDFSITIDIYVPQIGLPMIGWEANTYNLGKLLADTYSFNAEVRVWDHTGFLSELLYYGKSFTVAYAITVPDDYPTIQEAINNANPGDPIFVSSGTYYENVVVNKSVSLIGESKESTIVEGSGAETVILVNADKVSVSGFEIRDIAFEWGIWGIVLNHSSNSRISGNVLKATEAISVLGGSGNDVANNEVVGLDVSCVFHGIELANSSNNVVVGNFLSHRCHVPLRLRNASENYIGMNCISGHFVPTRFIMEKSNNNTIACNTMWTFADYERYMDLVDSSGNVIFHNNFVYTYEPGTIHINANSTNNEWDNGCEGNYWSAYNGTDINRDGIGDTYLPWEGVDYYPLMNPYWNPADINHDLKVDIYDAVSVCAAYSSTPSDSHWNPHCDIAEPYGVIDIYDITMICTNYGEEYNP